MHAQMDFRVLCKWMLDLYKMNPSKVWSIEGDCFDLQKLQKALPSAFLSDLILAANLVKHDVALWRLSKDTSVN